MQRGWLQVALAALVGLGSLAVCCGAFVAIGLLVFASGPFGWIGSSLDPTIFWFGVVAAMIFAGAGLSLPALALGTRGRHALLKSTVLSGFGFGAFVVFFLLTLDEMVRFPLPLTLMALVGTPVVGSLFAVQDEEGYIAVSLGGVPVIVAVAIYCASLLAYGLYWLVPGDNWPSSFLAPLIVAAFSWPVLPGIVAMLRSG